mmetsp:Transcript_15172/g.45737  ORF Transcript_15172/g.45737 Transcript_15172/m.45737 type:complete len:213 (+) Transcript_15172:712-1350(+)
MALMYSSMGGGGGNAASSSSPRAHLVVSPCLSKACCQVFSITCCLVRPPNMRAQSMSSKVSRNPATARFTLGSGTTSAAQSPLKVTQPQAPAPPSGAPLISSRNMDSPVREKSPLNCRSRSLVSMSVPSPPKGSTWFAKRSLIQSPFTRSILSASIVSTISWMIGSRALMNFSARIFVANRSCHCRGAQKYSRFSVVGSFTPPGNRPYTRGD